MIACVCVCGQVGSYSVAVLHQGVPISGTPYTVEAADPRRVSLQPAGDCFSSQECALKVDASGKSCVALAVLLASPAHCTSPKVITIVPLFCVLILITCDYIWRGKNG